MKSFEQCKTGAAVAKAIRSAHALDGKAQEGKTAFFRDSVKTPESTEILREALRLLALEPEMRQSKYPEAGPFYMARTILASEKRMTAPDGEYHGHFKVTTKNCQKDGNKRLVTAPELEEKVRDADKPEPEAPAAGDALLALVKWAKGKDIQFLGALVENGPDAIYVAIGDAYESKAKALRQAEADAANGAQADERQAA
ncbi:MAG: hypothetical protein ACXAB9_10460 [Candidatus Thorarchaeota archaeon]